MIRVFVFIFLSMVSFMSLASQDILLYTGPGAGTKSIANTLATVKKLVSDKYQIKTVGPKDLRDSAWMQNTALLIMPGGADRPYVAELSGLGNANIKEYVNAGGKYLGICAGAYYSADRIEFAKGDKTLEVTGERELKFFPDLVEGPTYKGFDHRNTDLASGMRAAEITWSAPLVYPQGKKFVLFYNGGGHFVNADKYSNVQILARYMNELPSRTDSPAAIIECSVGKGTVILSGPHFEWVPDSLEGDDPELIAIRSKLLQSDNDRLILTQTLLTRLGIETKQ